MTVCRLSWCAGDGGLFRRGHRIFGFACLGLARAWLAGGLCLFDFDRFLNVIGSNADRRRKDRQVKAIADGFAALFLLIAAFVALGSFTAAAAAIVAVGPLTTIATVAAFIAIATFRSLATLRSLATFRPLTAVITFIAFRTLAPLRAVAAFAPIMVTLWTAIFAVIRIVGLGAVFVTGFDVAFFVAPITTFTIIAAPFALRTAFFLPAAVIGQHAEIMVCELVIIFGLHAVAIQLGILRQLFIFFEHLRRIATRPVVDPVLMVITVTVVALCAIIAPAATAAGLPVIHKDLSVLIKSSPVVGLVLNATALCGSPLVIDALG